MTYKQCIKCKEWKNYKDFHKDKSKKDGYISWCKKCRKQYYEENKEQRKQYRKKYYEENIEKIKEYNKQYYEENIEKIKEYNEANKERRKQINKQHNNSPMSYNSKVKYRKKIELYEEIKESPDGNVMCKCAYCGEWFVPTYLQIRARIDAIRGNIIGEHRIYCSQGCKNDCPIYWQKLYPKSQKPATSREVQPELRQMVFERDNYTCKKCNIHKDDLKVGIHCHHKEGILWEPLQSADIDMCITLCESCHKKVHKIDGCGYIDLKCGYSDELMNFAIMKT